MALKHKRIPIIRAREIAKKYGYNQVVIFGMNRETCVNWRTTYGDAPDRCQEAARIGDIVASMFGDQSLAELKELRIRLNDQIGILEAFGMKESE